MINNNLRNTITKYYKGEVTADVVGDAYMTAKRYSAAASFYIKAAEHATSSKNQAKFLTKCGMAFHSQHKSLLSLNIAYGLSMLALTKNPSVLMAYLMISDYYIQKEMYFEAYVNYKICLQNCNLLPNDVYRNIYARILALNDKLHRIESNDFYSGMLRFSDDSIYGKVINNYIDISPIGKNNNINTDFLKLFKNIKKGRYYNITNGDFIDDTYYLEKNLKWDGYSIIIGDNKKLEDYNFFRNEKVIRGSAYMIDYSAFIENIVSSDDNHVDLMNIKLINEHNNTITLLRSIDYEKYDIKNIAVETGDNDTQYEVSLLLQNIGYRFKGRYDNKDLFIK